MNLYYPNLSARTNANNVKQKDLEISRHSKGNKTGHSHPFKQCQLQKGIKVILMQLQYTNYIKGLEHVSIDFKNVWSLDGKLIIQLELFSVLHIISI